MKAADINPVLGFLACSTPAPWLQAAKAQIEILLIDHAHCEKKAAATALNLSFRYVQHGDLLIQMSRLAREELRHFEQVLTLMNKRNISYRHLSASRYAEGLRRHARTDDPNRLVDILIIGAFIEARSCERFHALIPQLDRELADFYRSLLRSEARHFKTYLDFAARYSTHDIGARVAVFRDIEADLIQRADRDFRFHSGVPVAEDAAIA